MTPRVCNHLGCSSCRTIVVGQIAQLLATVPEELRAALCVEAMRLAKAPAPAALEAQVVERMIG